MKIANISFEKSVGAVMLRRQEGKVYFLLLHYISGHWDFPKGHVEAGEREHDTLKREVAEETGIDDVVILSKFRKSIFYSYKPKGKEKKRKNGTALIIKQVVYYICETENKNIILSDEHKGFVWLEFEEAASRITHENGRRILIKAQHFLQKVKTLER